MSLFYRKENYREQLFLKNLHLRICNKKLATILARGYSKEEYVAVFKDCFPHLWEDIVHFCDDRKENYFRRKQKGLRTVPYKTPEKYLLTHAGIVKIKDNSISDEQRIKIKEQLVRAGQKKLQKRRKKLENNLIYVQEVCPPYIDELIKTYFKLRKQQTLDINARYLILIEASQFKCSKTLSFLRKINACEKNRDMRTIAYFALQRMGDCPWLSRERKGKKRLSHIKRVDIKANPTELLNMINKYQSLLFQKFDIFLSHSSRDEKELLQIKSTLNRQGYTVYIDWVNDREMLNRANQDENTWNALFLRMDQSYRLLYVMTDNCINSEYTKKEVEYFKAKNKSVYIYQPKPISLPKPEYLNGCVELENIDFVSFT